MRHLLLKHRSGKICGFDMRIKMIPGEISKAIDIFRGDHPFRCDQLLPDLQIIKIFFKRMNICLYSLRMWLVYACNGGDHCWRSLQSGTLQIVFHSPQSSHFLSTSCTSGTAMHQQG